MPGPLRQQQQGDTTKTSVKRDRPSRRAAAMRASATPKRGLSMRRHHTVPEPHSLQDVLLQHPGTSLFVMPICWTPLHTRLLGTSFSQLPEQRTPMPASTSSPRRSRRIPPTVVKIQRDLNTLLAAEDTRPLPLTKTRALKDILATFFPSHLSRPRTCADLDIRFGDRCYAKAVRVQAIWKHPDSGSSSFDSAATCSNQSASNLFASLSVRSFSSSTVDHPVLAYLSRSHLNHIRHNCFRISSGPKGSRLYNGPVRRLQALRSKHLMPTHADEDQYFVAAIIALAQQAVYADMQTRRTLFMPRDIEVRVLTVSEEEESFIVYSAVVPASRLEMFDAPHKSPTSPAEIKISHTRVPVWPVLGLKERLGHALGREVVGDFNENGMDTYEEELTPVPETPSPKRRREVLSEVLNVSFSEDRDAGSPDPNENMVKRRRLEEGRVGLVR